MEFERRIKDGRSLRKVRVERTDAAATRWVDRLLLHEVEAT